jgi:DMSO reductase anchor subunit
MHPAYSLILFTVSSGAGYGLLAALGLMLVLGAAPSAPWLLLTALGLGLGLASFGLLASTRHLKRPERAWRAFSQWRTSWLSREGVAALAVYAVAVPLAGLLLLLPPGNGLVRLLAAATTALALATIGCTAMIYASLKPVPRWRHPAVPAVYLCLGLATGALLLDALFLLAGRDVVPPRALALLALLGAFVAKELSWRAAGRRGPVPLTTAAATGLARFGEVRLLEAPHTEGNYLLREMGYQVARRHACKLRRVVRLAAFAVPSALVVVLLLVELPSFLRGALAALAAGSAVLGALVERWLFFAEARHTVSLYYGAGAA